MGRANVIVAGPQRRPERGPIRVVARLAFFCTLAFLGYGASGSWAGSPVSPRPARPSPAGKPEGRPRVLVEVALGAAPPPGTDGLAYFVPEVGRSLNEGLRRAGVNVAAAGEAGVAQTVAVAIDERPGDRVELVTQLRGQRVDVEGPVERIDALVEALVGKLATVFLEGAPVGSPTPLSALSANAPRPSARVSPLSKPGSPSEPAASAPVATAPVGSAPAPAAPTSPPPQATATPTASAPAAPVSSPSATAATLPTAASPPANATPVSATTPPPAASTTASSPIDPYGPDARVTDPTPTSLSAGSDRAGYVRGRAVVHTIAEPAGPYAGAGSTATQALYAVLQRRLRLSVVPMGAGMTSATVAAEEGQRTQSRIVVMGRVDALSVTPDPIAPGSSLARLRLEIAVVRDGRLALRRAVLAETPPSDARRGRVDPVYLAVAHALEGMLGELSVAVGDGR